MKNLYQALSALLFACIVTATHAQITFTDMGSMLQSIGTTSYADCAADMDGDGYDDVVRVVGSGIYIDYQQPNGTFTPAYFPMTIQNLPSWSICAADIDGNGFTDLVLGAGNAVSFVYANDAGNGFIEDAHPEYIFTQRSTFADIDNDGNLDAFCNHDVDQCHPYRNVNGVLELDFNLIQTLDAGGNYAAIWVDYDNDWDSDLYITKCRGGALWGDAQRINLLYRNNGDGTYTEVGAQANMNDGNQSWATVFEDFDNDGDFDAFTVNHASSDVPGGAANKFMNNNGDGTFTDIISTTGINAGDLGAWNCDAGDFDNDGWVDIFSEMGTEMYWNNGNGTFTGAQLSGFNSGGIGDFNDDGFLDVISGNSLWINNGNQNHHVKFDLEGIVSNKSAVGARIEIYGEWGMQIREVRAGESFDPGSSLIAHFGIGASTSITQAIIKWPSGMVTVLDNPGIDQTHHVIEAGCMGDPVTITAAGATTICPGQSVVLNAPAGSSYTWSNGATTQNIEATNGGNYSVIVWNESNCASVSNMIHVEVIEEDAPSITLSGEEVFCEGTSAILTSSVANSYLWSNGQTGQSIVVTQPGTYHVVTTGQCNGVTYTSDNITLNVLPAPSPTATDVTIGEPGTAMLTATGTNLTWYGSASGNDVVGTGNSFSTPICNDNCSYWVESTSTYGGEVMNGGRTDNSGTGSLPASGGRLFFDVYEPFTLQEITVYVPAEGVEGLRTIELYDAANTLLASTQVNCLYGANTFQINLSIPVGTGMQLGCAENNLFRNNGTLEYPYAIGDVGQINSTTFGTGYYYYFYNWKIKKQETVCVSDRVEVSLTVQDVLEISNPLEVRVFPNPVVQQLQLTSAQSIGRAEIAVYDVAGKLVHSSRATLTAGQPYTLDVDQLAAGQYTLRVSNNNGISSVEFVKR